MRWTWTFSTHGGFADIDFDVHILNLACVYKLLNYFQSHLRALNMFKARRCVTSQVTMHCPSLTPLVSRNMSTHMHKRTGLEPLLAKQWSVSLSISYATSCTSYRKKQIGGSSSCTTDKRVHWKASIQTQPKRQHIKLECCKINTPRVAGRHLGEPERPHRTATWKVVHVTMLSHTVITRPALAPQMATCC